MPSNPVTPATVKRVRFVWAPPRENRPRRLQRVGIGRLNAPNGGGREFGGLDWEGRNLIPRGKSVWGLPDAAARRTDPTVGSQGAPRRRTARTASGTGGGSSSAPLELGVGEKTGVPISPRARDKPRLGYRARRGGRTGRKRAGGGAAASRGAQPWVVHAMADCFGLHHGRAQYAKPRGVLSGRFAQLRSQKLGGNAPPSGSRGILGNRPRNRHVLCLRDPRRQDLRNAGRGAKIDPPRAPWLSPLPPARRRRALYRNRLPTARPKCRKIGRASGGGRRPPCPPSSPIIPPPSILAPGI